MDSNNVVDIYGNILDKSELIIAVGNYNNIHGLLTFNNNLLEMRTLFEIESQSVIKVIYQEATSKYFSLYSSQHNKYLNVDIDDEVATAILSNEKALFWIDYSIIDQTPRDELLAGVLYSLKTRVDDKEYIVSWKIKDFSNGDLIIFLPTTWYERVDNVCILKRGSDQLIQKLNQLHFKGYTNEGWCQNIPTVTNCNDDKTCGECLGKCSNHQEICSLYNNNLICQSISNNKTRSNNLVIWIALITIVIIVALLAWGIMNKYKY